MAVVARRCRGAALPLRGKEGQSTIEFLLVAAAFSALCCALAAMWRAASSGRLLALAMDAASHNLGAGVVAALKDIVVF